MAKTGVGRLPLRQRVELAFERWGHTVARHRGSLIVLMLGLGFGLGSQLVHVSFDTSNESMFKRHDPTRVTYDEFRAQFGREDLILVAVESSDVFSAESLERLRVLHDTLEREVPHIDDIISLVNARSTRGEAGELIVGELLEDWPETPGERSAVRDIALANPLYRDRLLSRDGRVTTIVLQLDAYSSAALASDGLEGFDESEDDGAAAEPAHLTGDETAEAAFAVQQIVERLQAPDFQLYYAGGPIIGTRIMYDMQRNMRVFIVLILLTVAALLFILFRRLSGVLLPLLVVLLAVAATFGFQGLRGVPLGVPTQIVPSFLLAVGVGAAVHILVIFFQRYDSGDSAEEAVCFALGHSGLAVVMTSLTTAGGLVSFMVAEVAPVADLGVLAPVGILAGLVYCLVLLPALLVTLPLHRREGRGGDRPNRLARVLVAVGDFSVCHPRGVLIATALVIAFALAGALRISFRHDTLRWFQEDDPVRTHTAWIDAELAGTMALELMVDTGRENGLQDPVTLAAFDRLGEEMLGLRGGEGLVVRKTLSLADVVKEINQALDDNRPGSYRVPEQRDLIAQELLLFENSGSDDLEDFVDSQFRLGRFTLQMPYVAPENYLGFIDEVEAAFRRELGPDVEIRTTGFMALLAASLHAVTRSMFASYTLALLIITPLMMLLIGSLRGGLASMLPNLVPILLVLGLIGWTGMDFDLFTLMIGSIAIGLAVDDTIHFMHNFYRYFRQSGDTRDSVRRTLETTGQAMLVTSVVLSTGFFIYTFAELNNLANFGRLTALAIALAFLADLLIAPALVAIATRGKQRQRGPMPPVRFSSR